MKSILNFSSFKNYQKLTKYLVDPFSYGELRTINRVSVRENMREGLFLKEVG